MRSARLRAPGGAVSVEISSTPLKSRAFSHTTKASSLMHSRLSIGSTSGTLVTTAPAGRESQNVRICACVAFFPRHQIWPSGPTENPLSTRGRSRGT
jgi:hypothetical protein